MYKWKFLKNSDNNSLEYWTDILIYKDHYIRIGWNISFESHLKIVHENEDI